MQMQQIVINGNNIDILKQYPDNYFDSVVTDAPYGLGKEPIAEELMKDWIEKGYHEVSGSGFMGKEWDAFVPQPIFWKEVFRVLKYGGHCLSFYGSRTYDWGVMAMRFAGFEVRDTITWHFGSGFPKSHNVSKAIDKIYGVEREVVGSRELLGTAKTLKGNNYNGDSSKEKTDIYNITAPATDQAKQWEGWGSALKPASEYIVLARKPLEKGLSIAENVLKWGTGAINIDGCRVGFKNESDYKESTQKNQHQDFGTKPMTNNNVYGDYSMVQPKNYEPSGRFPANLILTHHPECECVGTKKVKGVGGGQANHIGKNINNDILGKGYKRGGVLPYADENGEETIEDWICVDGCPIKELDEQSGESKSPNTYTRKSDGVSSGNSYQKNVGEKSGTESKNFGDKGGASRFFYQAKASKSERNKGLEGFDAKQMAWSNQAKAELKRGNTEFADDTKMHNKVQERVNFHPTVKPIKLMQYLVRLVTPPNGIVLDPFVGSGTTGIAAKLEGFNFVGIEQDAEYCKIAQARIENYVEEIQKPTKRKVETDEPVTDEIINTTQLGLF